MTCSSTSRTSGQCVSKCTSIHTWPLPPPHPCCDTLPNRMRLCVSVTEAEVERAKNVFKTSLFMHLDGQCVGALHIYVCPLCVFVCMVYVGMHDVCFCAPHMLCVCV